MAIVDSDPVPTFTTKQGVVFQLRPISRVVLRRLTKDAWGKPQPPIVETVVGKQKHKIREANPHDPEYKAALALWEEEHEERTLIYLFSNGICGEPDAKTLARFKLFLPGDNEDQLKYNWIMEQITDDEIQPLSVAIMGLTVPTEQGIGVAEEQFPGDSERSTDSVLSVTEGE